MNKPLVCMTLTGKTLEEDYKLVKKYEKQIDLVELRADCLNEDEQLYIKRFPALIYPPCILSIRRDIDGGRFNSGEFSRTNLFGRALAFANPDRSRNYAYVEFEDDFQIPSIQDAAMAFGVKIIRSYHSINENLINIKEICDSMRKTGYEIPKIAFRPSNLKDVATLFKESQSMFKYEHIVTAIGLQGQPSRILAHLTGSYLTYVSPGELEENTAELGHTTPETLLNLYNFRELNENTKLFGIAGWPLQKAPAVQILNKGFKERNYNAISLPIRSPVIRENLYFAEQLDFHGLVIREPFHESVIYYLKEKAHEVDLVGACNTIIRRNNKWAGFNTEITGFRTALTEFLGDTKIKRKKVALLGAGSSAKAVAYVLWQLGAKVCIFNRTLENAQILAEKYGFKYSPLDPSSVTLLDEYSTLIIQTTTVGSDLQDGDIKEVDPISFYNFRGDELLFDLIYSPAITPLMRRASLAGCRTSNGKKMMEYSTHEQYKLFTGDYYNS